MTVGKAKAIISYIWLIVGTLVLAIVIYLTLIGKFKFGHADWDAGLAWAIPLILPVLGFMIPTWTISTSAKDEVVLRNTHVFFAAVLLSIVYLLALFVVLWRLPLEIREIEEYVNQVMRTSQWFLGTLQALIVAVLGKFFLEEVHKADSESDRPPRRRGNRDKGQPKA